ncbi:MAG: hypothetical protein QOI39_225, partial [Mycobacterium sp.]|nr:hypothetical protein [Mycobacterium sp.]
LILTALQIGLRSDEHRRGARSRSGVGRRSSNRQAQGDDCGVAHRCLSQQSAAPGRAYHAGAWLLRRQRCVQRYGRMRWRQRHSKRLTTMKWSRKAVFGNGWSPLRSAMRRRPRSSSEPTNSANVTPPSTSKPASTPSSTDSGPAAVARRRQRPRTSRYERRCAHRESTVRQCDSRPLAPAAFSGAHGCESQT